MFGQLLLHLLWLSSVYSETIQNTLTDSNAMVAISENSMPKTKRGLIANSHSPCPPFYPHFGGTYLPPPTFSRPYGPPTYPKKEIIVPAMETANHVQFIHQPIYAPPIKQTVSYVKPVASAINYQTIHKPIYQHVQPIQPVIKQQVQLSTITPKVTFEKPLLSYHTNLVQAKPSIHAISYPKPIAFSPINFNKYELPAPQIVHQKPTILLNTAPPCDTPPIIHQAPPQQQLIHVPLQPAVQPKFVHVPPQISYAKITPVQPVHQIAYSAPTVHTLPSVPTFASVNKISEIKVGHTCVK